MRTTPRRTAFTLVELLVTIGIIFLLATIVIAALGGVRNFANRTESLNAIRSMAAAYNTYSADNKQQLMPGYMDTEKLVQFKISPRLASGNPVDPGLGHQPQGEPLNPNDASSYVWRLAPYLDNDWKTMFIDYRSDAVVERISLEIATDEYGPGTTSGLGASLAPSFGLNSVYLGGDNVHGGNLATDYNPWDNPGQKLAATRMSEVRNPTRVILFAPSVQVSYLDEDLTNDLFQGGAVGGVKFGSPELRPPSVSLPDGSQTWLQWHVDPLTGSVVLDGDFSATDATGRVIGGGLPIGRGKTVVPLSHVDGSTSSKDFSELAADVEGFNWSPWVTRIR